MTKMSEISQLYKKVQNKDLNEGVDDVVIPFIKGAGKGARSLDDLIKGAKGGEKITDDMLKGLSKNDLETFRYQTRDLTPPAPEVKPNQSTDWEKLLRGEPSTPKKPAGGDSMVRRKEAISPDEALDQLKAGDRPQDVSNRLRNTVRTTMNPSARQAEVESMSKLDKFKDVAKKVVPPLAVAGTAAALLSRDSRDRQTAVGDPTGTDVTIPKLKTPGASSLATSIGAGNIPVGTSSAAAEPATPASTPEEPTKIKIASGDTLSDLAKKNKVSVADIAKANPELKDIHKINVGQELVMPKTTGNKIYQYGVGTESGPKSSKDIKSLLQKQENRDRVNESFLSAFNDVISSKSDNLFAEAKKKEKKADKDYDQDGKVESAKDEVWGSRFKAAKESGKLKEENLDEKYLRPIKKSENSIDATPVVDTISDFTRGVWTGAGGSLAKAALDYSVKNLGSKVGLGQGTTWEKESSQEEEKDTAARERSPLAYRTGEVGGTIAGVTSLPALGVRGAIKGVQLGAKYGPKLVGAAVRETPVLDKTLKGAKVVQDVTDKMTYPAAAGAMGAHLATAEKGEFRGQGPVLSNTRALIDKTYGQIPKLFQKKETVTESAKGSVPKTEKEKSLAALAEPKDRITHKDVLVGRGVVKENELGEGLTIVDTSPPKSGSVGEVPTQQVQTVKIKKPIEKTFVDKVMSDPNMTSPKRMGPAQTFEEFDFSEAELAHIASIVEGMPIAPTPDEQAPSGGIKKRAEGSKSGTLSDSYQIKKDKLSEEHDVVIGKGTIVSTDPKTGKKVDYISPVTLNNPNMQASKDEFKMPNPVPLPPKRPKELLDLKYKKMTTDADIEAIKKDLVKEAKNQEDNEPVATGANKLHVNAKKAADYNTPNVKHKFENGEEVVLTRGMAGDFLARHRQAKTADDKDAILKHANKSLDAFKSIAKGEKVPSEPKTSAKPKISLGSMKGK